MIEEMLADYESQTAETTTLDLSHTILHPLSIVILSNYQDINGQSLNGVLERLIGIKGSEISSKTDYYSAFAFAAKFTNLKVDYRGIPIYWTKQRWRNSGWVNILYLHWGPRFCDQENQNGYDRSGTLSLSSLQYAQKQYLESMINNSMMSSNTKMLYKEMKLYEWKEQFEVFEGDVVSFTSLSYTTLDIINNQHFVIDSFTQLARGLPNLTSLAFIPDIVTSHDNFRCMSQQLRHLEVFNEAGIVKCEFLNSLPYFSKLQSLSLRRIDLSDFEISFEFFFLFHQAFCLFIGCISRLSRLSILKLKELYFPGQSHPQNL